MQTQRGRFIRNTTVKDYGKTYFFLCPFKPRNSIEKLLGIFCAPLDLSVVYFPLFLNEDSKYTYTQHFTVC